MPSISKKRDPGNLCESDRKQMDDSGLTSETIEQNRIKTENGALVFPYCDLEGRYNGFARTRPHKPRKDSKGKVVKYEQPKGTPPRAYFPAASLPIIKQPLSPIFITEGEKKALALAQNGIGAIGLGGVYCWKEKGEQELIPDLAAIDWREREVFIVFDRDEKAKTRANVRVTMKKLASVLRQAGAREVYSVEIPEGQGKGIDDFLVASGEEAEEDFRTLIGTAQPVGTGERESRRSGEEAEEDDDAERLGCFPVDPFPVDCLPRLLRKYIESVADALPCPVDFPGVFLLAVLSTFIGRKRFIEIKASWREYPVLWTATVARSGDRKSAAFKLITEALRIIQKCLENEYKVAMAKYDNAIKEKQDPGEKPRLKQISTTDTTIEALKDILAGNPHGIIYPADELSGWARSMSQYKGGRGDDRQHWLSIWSSMQIISNRKSNPEPLIIDDPFVSIMGGIQPDALGAIIDDRSEDGFAARVLFSYPDAIPPGKWNENVTENDLLYHGVCRSLWEMELSDRPVTFSPEAKAEWEEFVNEHRKEKPPTNLRPVWSKMEGYCARLILVLYISKVACAEVKGAPLDNAFEVDPETVIGAAALIDYFKTHAQRVYGYVTNNHDRGRIGKALRWIKAHGGKVTAREARQYGLAPDPDEAKSLLKDLADLGFGEVEYRKKNNIVFTLAEH